MRILSRSDVLQPQSFSSEESFSDEESDDQSDTEGGDQGKEGDASVRTTYANMLDQLEGAEGAGDEQDEGEGVAEGQGDDEGVDNEGIVGGEVGAYRDPDDENDDGNLEDEEGHDEEEYDEEEYDEEEYDEEYSDQDQEEEPEDNETPELPAPKSKDEIRESGEAEESDDETDIDNPLFRGKGRLNRDDPQFCPRHQANHHDLLRIDALRHQSDCRWLRVSFCTTIDFRAEEGRVGSLRWTTKKITSKKAKNFGTIWMIRCIPTRISPVRC